MRGFSAASVCHIEASVEMPDMKSYTDQNLVSDYLYPREHARQILGGISIATLARLEKAGVLKPIRLNKRSPTAQVFYKGRNLREAMGG
jgi:hypothetical protein